MGLYLLVVGGVFGARLRQTYARDASSVVSYKPTDPALGVIRIGLSVGTSLWGAVSPGLLVGGGSLLAGELTG